MHQRVAVLLNINDGILRLGDHPRLRATLERLVARGTLMRPYPGVVARSDAMGDLGRLRALQLWMPQSVVHAETAAAIWLDQPLGQGAIRVANRYARAPQPGVVLTKRHVPDSQIRQSGGLRVVSLAYAAVELAAQDGGRTMAEGLRRGLVTTAELDDALAALAWCPGTAVRREVVASCRDAWSFAERVVQGIFLDSGIEGWVANPPIRVSGRLLHPDLLFPEQRLIVEIDGYETHAHHDAFVRDRERQNLLVLAGFRVLRFTWEHVTNRPEYIVATVRAALRSGGEGA